MKTFAMAVGETFAVLFPIVDPLGNVPTFMALTASHDDAQRRFLVRRVVLLFASILIVFAALGEPLLEFFGISLEALQISGGLIVAYTGFRMITATDEFVAQAAAGDSVAFSPLAIPLLAGPGAMAAVLGLESREGDLALALPGTIVGILAIGLVVFLAFTFSARLTKLLGPGGVNALNLIMGLLVLAIGIELIVHGIVTHGALVEARS